MTAVEDKVAATRQAQGLPSRVSDPSALAKVAALLTADHQEGTQRAA